MGCDFIPSLCRDLVPAFHRSHNLRRNPERRVDFPVNRLRRSAPVDFQNPAIGRVKHHGDHLMSAQLLVQAPLRSVHPAIQESLLDGHQQVISQNAEEDMRLGAMPQVMKNGPLG